MPSTLQALALALPATRLSAPDLGIVALYLIAITLFGLRFREKKGAGKADKSLKSYFLANNTIPWWAIALSIVSAETSTLTIISIPGVAFAGDFGFLQIVIGYMLGRVVVAALFLPRYFAGEMLTAYQLIDQRFGPTLHKVTAGLFLLTRAAAEGVRVFAVSIVVGIAIGTGDTLSIAIISALTLLYTFEGGMAAVVWTDVVQMCIYVAGTLVAVFTLGSHVTGGWSEIHTVASAAQKFHVFNFALNLTQSYTFWAGVLGGTFLTMASHGTDQLMVQRLLAARNLRESRLALLSSGVVIFMQFSLFLIIGAGLYVFYAQHPATFSGTDRIFPTFIVREMPIGIAGLLVAAILAAAMSNLSAALNSLSSTTVVDFYLRFREPRVRVPHLRDSSTVAKVGIGEADPSTAAQQTVSDRERNIVSKASTVLWALVLFAIAIFSVRMGGKGHVVEIALSIASVAYGCLLGVFLLGTLTRFATEIGTAIGMVCGFVLNIWLWQGTFPKVILRGGALTPNIGHPDGRIEIAKQVIPTITIPHIAFTWYVIIGALVTFAIGSLASLIFRKQSRRTALTTAAVALLSLLLTHETRLPSVSAQSRVSHLRDGLIVAKVGIGAADPPTTANPPQKPKHDQPPDFTPTSTLINDAIAAHKLPGAVVIVGHKGKVVFHQAFGNRKLAGEPGLDGQPSDAEPMTEGTIFDMASLTKDLATATAIMQLFEAGKIASFDDPVEKYLPDFNSAADPIRSKVTLRMLLTHTSGEAPDVSLKDPWGLAAPDRNEGFHRALTTALKDPPASKFVYSDINFILLGMLVEKLSGQREDDYVREHLYKPLGMTHTQYHGFDRACGGNAKLGAAVYMDPRDMQSFSAICSGGGWIVAADVSAGAPTAHDDESKSDPKLNPNFDHLLRGTVHDPTTRRMGGVAGHAGLFSTAHDVSLYAQAFLDKLLRNTGPFPLKQATLQMMIQPQQPGANLHQIVAANLATQAALQARNDPGAPSSTTAPSSSKVGSHDFDPLLAPAYPAIPGQNLRGFGWDIDTAFSKPRGRVFPIGSFGHTGFTGTTLWIDPASDTFYVLLANAIHPRGGTPISPLRGEVATTVATALGLYGSAATPGAPSSTTASSSSKVGIGKADPSTTSPNSQTLTGIDILQSTHFTQLTTLAAAHNNRLRLAIFTNQAGIDRHHHRTIDILNQLKTYNIQLTTLFSPEHGLTALSDTEQVPSETDAATGIHVTGLYGAKLADRHPTHDMLKDLDAVVIDLQDAGVHFWTYEAAMGYFLDAASREQREFHHRLDIVILDRPNLVGGVAVQGPVSDPGIENYTNYMPLPARHGMTFGELARYFNQFKLDASGKPLKAPLTIVNMQNWTRDQYFANTGLPWVNPSPNLRDPEAAILYPGIGLIETTNISVGRGTTEPFHIIGAGAPATTKAGAPSSATASSSPKVGEAWFSATEVAAALTARHIPGITFTATTVPVIEDANKYPYHGQTIEAIRFKVTDPTTLDTPELGIEILSILHKLYPTQFHLDAAMRLIDNQSTIDALKRGDDPRSIAVSWQPTLDTFKANRAKVLLY